MDKTVRIYLITIVVVIALFAISSYIILGNIESQESFREGLPADIDQCSRDALVGALLDIGPNGGQTSIAADAYRVGQVQANYVSMQSGLLEPSPSKVRDAITVMYTDALNSCLESIDGGVIDAKSITVDFTSKTTANAELYVRTPWQAWDYSSSVTINTNPISPLATITDLVGRAKAGDDLEDATFQRDTENKVYAFVVDGAVVDGRQSTWVVAVKV
jgi:hypothetical protein